MINTVFALRPSRWRDFCVALLGVAVTVPGWAIFPHARADVLTIGTLSGQGVPLRLQGVANKDYVVQRTDNLAAGHWSTLSVGATDGTGVFQTNDAGARGSAAFYRGQRLPGLVTTTATATTVPNNTVIVTVGGSDPLNPGGALAAIITQLPADGRLEQMDGTPITTVGTVVSDSQNRVQFVPAANALNPHDASVYTNFAYKLQRASDGVTSLPQTVFVSLAPNWVYSSFDDSTQKLQLAYSLDGLHWTKTGDLYTAPGATEYATAPWSSSTAGTTSRTRRETSARCLMCSFARAKIWFIGLTFATSIRTRRAP